MPLIKKIWRPLAAIALLFILIKKGPFQLEQIHFILSQQKVLLIGLILFSLQFVLFSYRWSLFVHLLVPLKLKPAFRLTLIGQFFSFFIPGGVGGDVVKALELSRTQPINKKDALSTVLADRILGLFTMILMSALFLLIEVYRTPDERLSHLLVVSSLLLLCVTTGLFLAPWIIQKTEFLFINKTHFIFIKLEKLIASFALTFAAFRNKKLQFINLLFCISIQCISIYFLYDIVQTLGISAPPFLVFFSICCFGFLASAIPITPAGIGVGQAAFYFLFATYSPELGRAAVTAVSVLQIFNLLFALFGGILFSIQPKKVRQSEMQSELL